MPITNILSLCQVHLIQKIKENGSYFNLYSTEFKAKKPDSITFVMVKKKHGI